MTTKTMTATRKATSMPTRISRRSFFAALLGAPAAAPRAAEPGRPVPLNDLAGLPYPFNPNAFYGKLGAPKRAVWKARAIGDALYRGGRLVP